MVELLPYQPVRVDGSAVDSKGVVDLGGPGLSTQVGLVTVDQAPVAVVITGLASVARDLLSHLPSLQVQKTNLNLCMT